MSEGRRARRRAAPSPPRAVSRGRRCAGPHGARLRSAWTSASWGSASRRAALLLGLVAWATSCQPARDPRPLNLVILLADDLGWADVGYHGGLPATPSIDALAAQGLRLERFYSSGLCTPMRAALLTGYEPARLGLAGSVVQPWSEAGLPQDVPTLAERLREAGYETALVGKWHLGHDRPEQLPRARGFEHFYGSLLGTVDYWEHTAQGALDWQRDGRPLHERGYSTELLGREAAQRILARDAERPLFLYVAFGAPHRPLQPPSPIPRRDAPAREYYRTVYRAMVESLDGEVGRILEALDEARMADDTLVLFASDNGADARFGDNGPLRGSKGSVFEGAIRVPAVLRLPGTLSAGALSDQVLRDYDLLPTLLAALGLDPGPSLSGEDFWRGLKEGSTRPRGPLFFEAGTLRGGHELGVLHGRWKLVRRSERGRDRDLLFDVEDDPSERVDRAASHPAVAARLGRELSRWDSLQPQMGVEAAPPPGWRAPADWAHWAERSRSLAR